MKNLYLTAFFGTSALFFAAPSHAEFLDGNKLHEQCKSDIPFCQAYIMGVVDTQDARENTSDASGNLPTKFLCLPNVKASQLVDVVKQSLESRPHERHWPATLLVQGAMIRAFPCPKK